MKRLKSKDQLGELQFDAGALLEQLDEGGEGHIHANELLHVLQHKFGLHLTQREITSLFDELDTDHDGTIDYVSLAPKAAQIIERLGSEEGQMERWEKVQALQDGDRVHGMYKDDFDEALRQALSAYDPSGTGAVSIQDWVDALSNSPIGFTAREIGGLFSLVRPSPSTPTLVLGLETDFLERHDVARVAILSLVHDSVRALPDLLHLLVPLHRCGLQHARPSSWSCATTERALLI